MLAYRSDPNVAKYQGWKPESVDQTQQLINRLSGIELDMPGTWFQLALVHRESCQLIGDCGLHFLKDYRRQSEIGITLAPSHQRQGYALEAVRAVLEYLFTGLGKHRVFASMNRTTRQ